MPNEETTPKPLGTETTDKEAKATGPGQLYEIWNVDAIRGEKDPKITGYKLISTEKTLSMTAAEAKKNFNDFDISHHGTRAYAKGSQKVGDVVKADTVKAEKV